MKLQAKSALKHRINMLDLKLQRSSFPTRRDYSTTLRSLLLFFNFNRKSFLQGAVTETGNSRGFPGRRQLITVGEVLKANAKHQVFTIKKNHLSTFTELSKYLETFIFSKKKKEKLQLKISYPLNGCSKLSTYYSPLNFNQSRESHACNMQL